MESRFNIYADLQLPLREVLKTSKGSEWQYAIFWLKEVIFFNSLIALLTLCTKKQHFGAIQKINQAVSISRNLCTNEQENKKQTGKQSKPANK